MDVNGKTHCALVFAKILVVFFYHVIVGDILMAPYVL